MAKKKKKKLVPIIVSIVIVLAIVLAGVFTFLLLKTPSPKGLAAKYKDEKYIAAFVGNEDKAIGTTSGLKAGELFNIIYYETAEDAKKAVETGKDTLGESVCFRRGRAVFVGTEGASKIFKGYLG